jgi:hypothetical protein
MKVTRDVIVDLWPAYASGEASIDTKALVEEFFGQDRQLERLLRDSQITVASSLAGESLPPDLERRTLSMTKKLLRRRTLFLALAIIFMAIPPAITTVHLHFEQWGLTSAFTRLPAWENYFSLGCISVSAAFWFASLTLWRRLRIRGF